MKDLPLYKKVTHSLRQDILNGVYQEGDLLPSENELCNLFGTTRMTVRQALGPLVNEGFIVKQKGKGSVVVAKNNSLGLLSFRGFSDVVGKTDHKASSQIIKGPITQQWPAPFFYPLTAEEKNAGCISLDRLRKVDGEPVMLEYTFVPNFGFDGLCTQPLVDGSLFKTLRVAYQLEMCSLEQDIRAINAAPEIAEQLGLGLQKGGKEVESIPVLHIYRKYSTSKKGTYVYSSLYCNTENYAIGSVHEQ